MRKGSSWTEISDVHDPGGNLNLNGCGLVWVEGTDGRH